MSEVEVIHNPEEETFILSIKGKEASLKYRKLDSSTLELYSTFVPAEGRGQGLAGTLTKEALEYAKDNNYSVRPTCSFVSAYIEKHKEYQKLVV